MRKIIQIHGEPGKLFALTSEGDVLVAFTDRVTYNNGAVKPIVWVSIYSSEVSYGDGIHQGVSGFNRSMEVQRDDAIQAERWAKGTVVK